MADRDRHDKAMRLIDEGCDDETIRVLTGYSPEVIGLLRREPIRHPSKTAGGSGDDGAADAQGELF